MAGYKLLDSGDFQKYEQIGHLKIVRPAAQAVWKPALKSWSPDVSFIRESAQGGRWEPKSAVPEPWSFAIGDLKLEANLTGFGHVGAFPEHHAWGAMRHAIRGFKRPFRLLHLFAYTGAVTLEAARLGAEVVHVDASKSSVQWARKNAELSGLSDAPIRWIVDDARKFVNREAQRGRTYDGVILDPPSFGRGAKGQVWKIEEDLRLLLEDIAKLRSDEFAFMQLSCHTPGWTPMSLENLLREISDKGIFKSFEMSVPETGNKRGFALPSGTCAQWFLRDPE
ncbi:MAG: RsmD family RNA methyltransferase [Oligoflexales bacterium]